MTYGNQSFDGTVEYSPMNWFETPAVVKFEAGNEFIKYIKKISTHILLAKDNATQSTNKIRKFVRYVALTTYFELSHQRVRAKKHLG